MISYRKLAMRVLGHSPVSAVKTARRSTGKRAAALALTAALVVGMTLPAFADVYDLTKGDISVGFNTDNKQTVTQEDGNGGYVKNKNNEDIKDLPDNDVVITTKDDETGKVETTDNTVTINSNEGKTANVTLDNVNIDTSKTGGAAVSVTGKGDTNIELNGNNTLTSGSDYAGLEHNKETDSEGKETSGTLTITDDKGAAGSLTANGGYHGAGIGGSNEKDGQVTITGGEITANGGSQGAGIGGGSGNKQADGGDGDVTISGGTITATGGSEDAYHSGGAGIGGGAYGNGTVTITDGDITAKSTGTFGAGIGGGASAKPKGTLIGGNGTVTISGGTITEASGGEMAAGIGSGYQGLGKVTIEGDAVIKNAQGGVAGAGIGSGSYGDSIIIIRGDAVIENAESTTHGAGIGSGQGGISNGALVPSVGNVTIEGNAKIENAKSGYGGSGIGGGVLGIGKVTIRGNAQIGNATGGDEGAGIGGGIYGTGDVTIEGNVTIENAQGGAGAAGIGGGAETEPDTKDTRSKVSIKSTEAGSPNITATGGGAYKDDYVSLPGAAAIGSGSVADDATEVKSDITVEGKVTINATSGGDVAIGDSTNGETRFSGLQVGTTITRRNAKGDDVSQPGDVVREQAPTETEAAEAPSTEPVEVERPVTVEGLYVTNVLGKQITHTCTQNGTTLTIRANGIVTSAHLTLGMVRTLKAQGVKTLVFTTLLSRSTTVSVDALLAAEPDAPDETAVVWTHTGPRAALTIDGADHSALLK